MSEKVDIAYLIATSMYIYIYMTLADVRLVCSLSRQNGLQDVCFVPTVFSHSRKSHFVRER